MGCVMSNDLCDLLDGLAARGRRLRGTLPGDYKPAESDDATATALARVYALILSWPKAELPERQWEEAGE